MIENFSAWIREHIFPRTDNAPARRQPGTPAKRPLQRALRTQVTARPKASKAVRADAPAELDPGDLVYDHAFDSQIEDVGPGKNVLKRSKYIREDAGTHDTLKILDENALVAADDDSGIDPYNTGQFDRSESWTKRSRE